MRIAKLRKVQPSRRVEYVGKRNWATPVQTKYDNTITKAMVIERLALATGKKEVITFSQAYGELSMWMNIAFKNISEFGFSDMLAETFFQGASVVTSKAEYRLWLKPQTDETFFQAGEIDMFYQDVQ